MRTILIVVDSLGIGAAPDAEMYGDRGADTLGHIFAQTPELALPALFSMGLGRVLAGSGGEGLRASYGRMRTRSPGKDSMTGHWELAGVILREAFAVYERLPVQLVEAIEEQAKVKFLALPGEEERRGIWKEHAATGRPLLEVMKGESAIEISAHEAVMSRRRLYEIGRIARRHVNAYRIGRVITQPLTGKAGAPEPGAGRHEYAMVPPRTILNAISEGGFVVEGVGKVADLFARSGVTHSHAAHTNAEAVGAIERVWERMPDGLLFANLEEFDGYGHARDVAG
jgi:phosphopentomutase